eukprot:scaffold82892_cov20-Tisochrysis_lutea.AAC.1
MEGDSGQARMQIRVQAPVQVEIPEGSTLEQTNTPTSVGTDTSDSNKRLAGDCQCLLSLFGTLELQLHVLRSKHELSGLCGLLHATTLWLDLVPAAGAAAAPFAASASAAAAAHMAAAVAASSTFALPGEAALGGRRAAAAAASQAPVDGRTGGFARPGCATRHQITGEAGGGAERGPAAATGGAAVCGAWGRAVQGVRALVVRAASSMAACAESLDFRGKLSFQHRMS